MTTTFRPLLSALWMGGSIVSFTLIAVAGRKLQTDLGVFEVMFYRSAIGLVVMLLIVLAMGRVRDLHTANLPLHALRAGVHYAGQALWLWALMLIPMAHLIALEFTSPLWVIAFSPLLLGESLTWRKALAAGLGFAGVLVVARPDMTRIDPGVLAALASAICFAFNIIFTKRLTRLGSILNIMVWLSAFQLVIGAVVVAFSGGLALPGTASLPWLVIIGLGALTAHFSLTKALSVAPASFVMPIDFVRLPLIAIVGVVLYQEALDLFLIAGATLILAGNWVNIRSARA